VPKFLARMDPMQRQLLMIGVPIVAVVVIGRLLRKPTAAPTQTGTIPGTANVDAIGSGQLAAFEQNWADALSDVQQSISELETGGVNTPAVPVDTVTKPQPLDTSALEAAIAAATARLTQATPPAASDPEPAVGTARSAVYGSGTPAATASQLPPVAPAAAGSVTAPSGGAFKWGTWENGVLVSGTYVVDGKYVTVKA
jgi:hypothetical protein